MAIKIDLVADASRAIKEAGNLGEALDKVADNLQDVGKDGAKIDDKVGEAFKSAGKDADKLDDKVSDAFRSIGQSAKKGGDDVGDAMKHGTDKANEGLGEMKDEAAGTAREAAASFSSLEDGADVLQETLANAFAGFGPAGMAAGILAAAGVGLIISQLTSNAEQITENKTRMLDLAQTIRDNGGTLTEDDYVKSMEDYGYAIQDTKEWWEIFQADAKSGFEELRDLAKETGISTKDMFRAGFGDADEAQKTLDKVTKRIQELKDKKEEVYNQTGQIMDPADASMLASLEKTKDLIDKNIQAQKDAEMINDIRKEGNNSLTDTVNRNAQAIKDRTDKGEEARAKEADLAAYIEGTTENYRKQADAIEESTDALKGTVTTELDYLDKQDALKTKLAESGNAWDINTAKGRENQRAVVDIASGIEEMATASLNAGAPVDQVTAKFQAQKDALVNQVLPAFHGNRDAAQEYIDKILQVPHNTVTDVKLTGESAVREGLNRLAQPVSVWLKPEAPSETYFQGVLAQLAGRSVPVTLAPQVGKGTVLLP